MRYLSTAVGEAPSSTFAVQRTYADVSDFRAPFDSPNLSLSGLGDDEPVTARTWPRGRAYYDVAHFRAPGQAQWYHRMPPLMGLGDVSPAALPEDFRRYIMHGTPMPTWKRDLGAASNQVPRWAWAGIGVAALFLGYKGYKSWRAEEKAKKSKSSP